MDTTERPWDMFFDSTQTIVSGGEEKIHIPLFPLHAGDYETILRNEVAAIAKHHTDCFMQLPYVQELHYEQARRFSWRKHATWQKIERKAAHQLGRIDNEIWWIIRTSSGFYLGTGSGTYELPVHVLPLFEVRRIAKDFDILRREAKPRDKLIHLLQTLHEKLDNTPVR